MSYSTDDTKWELNKHRLCRNKKTGELREDTPRYNGSEYVFLPMNDQWEVVSYPIRAYRT
jgi:hypothetical protein